MPKPAFCLQKRIKTAEKLQKNAKYFCPLLDIRVSGSPIIQDGERCDRRRWRSKGAERVAAVDKIEDQRKPEDFIGHRNRKTGRCSHPCACERPHHRLWHLHRKYVRRSCLKPPLCKGRWLPEGQTEGLRLPCVKGAVILPGLGNMTEGL